jgi:cysteine desulfurase
VSDWPKISITNDGFIKTSKINKLLSDWWDIPFTVMSCMYVNNEIGTIQPIKELSTIAHRHGILLHTDAVQAMPYIHIDVKDLGCDMLSASGHKFGAPKGIGFLYANSKSRVKTMINGGKQEDGIRPGTENILGILAMATALEDTVEHMDERNVYIKSLRDKLLEKLLRIPGAHLNGSLENRVPGNINIRFDGVSGSRLVSLCSLYGVYISAGSACNEGVAEPSHVLKAIGLSDEEALNSIRITIGHQNTEEEINTAANIITSLVNRIREDS